MGKVEASLSEIIGKTIAGVVVAKNKQRGPTAQIFLVFSDKTSFEIWTEDYDFSVASAVDNADKELVLERVHSRPNTEVWTFECEGFNLAMTQQDFWVSRDD